MTFFMLHILGRVISAIVDPGKHFRIRTPGRRLRRRLESSTSVAADPLLRKQTEQSVSTAMCESGDCFLVRTSTTAYAFSILLDLQFRLNLHLIPVFSTLTNGGRVSAFILTANIPPNSEYVSLFMREYILNCSLNLALCEPSHLISFQQNIIPRICDFPSLEGITTSILNFAIYNLETSMPLGHDLCRIIRNFVGTDLTEQRFFSSEMWKFLFTCCVIFLPRPRIEESLLRQLFSELQETGPSAYKNRCHKLFSDKLGMAYWWDSLSKSKPFRSNLNPQSLSQLRNILSRLFPQLKLCPEMLTSEYRKRRHNLSAHRDIALIEYLKKPEFVFLLFLGEKRLLRFTDSRSRPHRFQETITCHESNLIVLTPLANKIFYHAKLKSKRTTNHHALTLAFRKGIRIIDGFDLYPELRRHFPNICSEEEVTPIYGYKP